MIKIIEELKSPKHKQREIKLLNEMPVQKFSDYFEKKEPENYQNDSNIIEAWSFESKFVADIDYLKISSYNENLKNSNLTTGIRTLKQEIINVSDSIIKIDQIKATTSSI